MQFTDTDGNVRIQIGRDTNNEFTFTLYDETGQGVLIDSTGIKESAISDGLIKTDMVADGAITEDKIDKTNIREWTDENGDKVFDVSKLYYGDDKFEVSYTSTLSRVDELETKVGSIELMGEQIFKEIQGVVSPDTITLTAVCRNGVSVGKWYIDNIENTSYVSEDKSTITIPASALDGKNNITVKVEDSSGKLYDIQTLYYISDATGADGQAAISVIISSSNGTSFQEDTTITSTILTCVVYEGTTEITPLSYSWKIIEDDTANWQEIGTGKILNVEIDKNVIRKRIVCDVDLDIG